MLALLAMRRSIKSTQLVVTRTFASVIARTVACKTDEKPQEDTPVVVEIYTVL